MVNKMRNDSKGKRNSVRIIAGHLRGSKLEFSDIEGLRPTADRTRETLFNWLQAHVAGARCLDLFAGSGALGFEALSRGAMEVLAVELHPQVASQMQSEAMRLGVEGFAVCQADAMHWLAAQAGEARKAHFDIVFLDPPFAGNLLAPVANELEKSGILADTALLYVESPWLEKTPALPGQWQQLREKRIGEVRCALYERQP